MSVQPWLVTAATLYAQGVSAQALRVLQPRAELAHGFTHVTAVRELDDGRVLVIDAGERAVFLTQPDWIGVTQLGRNGAGPREYGDPTRILPLPNGSSLIFDRHFRRFLLISPNAEVVGVVPELGQLGVSTAGIQLREARTIDGRGNLYAQAYPIARLAPNRLVLVDSAAIERWAPEALARDTIAFVPVLLPPGAAVMSGRMVYPVPVLQAFRTSPQWAVAADGRVAIAYPDPYRVDLVSPDGATFHGQAIPYQPVRVSDALKVIWRRQWARSRSGTMLVVSPEGRSQQTVSQDPVPEPTWPATLPPFVTEMDNRQAIHFAPDGMLWIERSTPAEAPLTFDVIDRDARVAKRVQLARDRRLVGFGPNSLYAVRIDEFDLEYLERYALP